MTELPDWAEEWFEPKRFKVAYGGRYGTKSHTIAAVLLIMGVQRPLRILCAREVQKSIQNSVHLLLEDKINKLGLTSFYQVLETEIRGANGTLFLFSGLRSEVMNGLKSMEGVDIAWIEEANTVSQRSLDILIPTIRKSGSEIWFSYNPEFETDPVHKRFIIEGDDNALVRFVSMEDNPWATPEMIDEKNRAYAKDPAAAAWIWGGACRPAAQGAIYELEMAQMHLDGRICSVAYEQSADVIVAMDLGIGDHTSLVVGQWIGQERRVLHCYESFGVPLSHYIDHLKSLPYRIDKIVLPHDAGNRSLQTGRTPEELLATAFRTASVDVLPRTSSVEHDISFVKEHFGKVWIDRNAKELIESLKKYRRKFDERTNVFGDPLHDTYSDMADSFRYWMQAEVRKKINRAQNTMMVGV